MEAIQDIIGSGRTLVLDGGLSTQLELGGADLKNPLWSASVLLDDPDAILAAHRAFVDAGADVLITASYQVSFEGFAARGLDAGVAAEALRASVRIAREAADRVDRDVIVAASVGPYGAILADGSEYHGHYALTHAELAAFHRSRIEILLDEAPDLLAIETIPSIAEAQALVEVLEGFPDARAWFTFTCIDGETIADGTPFAEAVAVVTASPQVIAVGVNCTSPEFVSDLIRVARRVTAKPAIVYPNRGGGWDAETKHWLGAKGAGLPDLAPAWREAGASLIGGCCGTDAADIKALASALASDHYRPTS
ncbi:MAG: homocysteine S-methyltransferase [Actinomycetota bacterium]|nr:homocysteine S-methyltransferase [Actinomycetota bacterium]